MPETVVDKAARLLSSGRTQIQHANQDRVTARVLGDSGVTHIVTWDHGAWECSCPSFGPCSHKTAVGLVTMRPVLRLLTCGGED